MKNSNVRRIAAGAAMVLAAAACGGEVATEPEDSAPEATDADAPDDPEESVESTDSDATDPDEAAPDDAAADDDTDDSEDSGGDGGDGAAVSFVDPRGDIFNEFQATIDRSHPFNSLDALCLPHDAAENREATDRGITADGIEVHHIRQQLEELESIGFGVELGDVEGMFDALINEINETCGGVRGRLLEPGVSTFSPLGDIEAETAAACIGATEDRDSVIAVNSSGIQGPAVLCVAEEHETMFITTQGLPADFLERAGGRLISMDAGLDESPAATAQIAHDQGLLEGKTIGVVTSDAPGKPEAIDAGLIATLEELGYEIAVYDTIGCGGQTACTDGVQESVGNMLSSGVDALFPALNILSLPGYVSEMVTQGYVPGDIEFFQSNFDSQTGDLVSSKVAAFGGEAAAALYNGAFFADSASTGNQLLNEGFIPPFNQLCMDAYINQGGPSYDYFESGDNTVIGMLSVLCSEVRMMVRAIYDAGDNPTRQDIYDAMANLGPIDTNDMIPASLAPGKYTAVDAFQTMTWTSPCEFEGGAFDENDTCVVPNQDYVSIR